MKKVSVRTGAFTSVVGKLVSALAAAALLFSFASTAYAQQAGGAIRGSVDGASANTTVEVVDQSRGTRKTESASDGEFRFENLNPGSYEVRVVEGGTVVDSVVVSVQLGEATTVNMATTAEAIEEIVTTGTRVAALDTSIAESGLVIDAAELLEMPIPRDMGSVALLAPGVSQGDNRFGNSGNVSFAGASIAENTSFINGLNTTNFRTGVGFSKVPFEFYETLQIKTGGYSAKYGRSLGGVMNAKSKSGSNEWNFGANVYYESEISESPDTYSAANALDSDDNLTADIYASGPILKDRLFFYALYSDNQVDQRYAGYLSQQDIDYEVSEGFWGAKIDGYITDNHHIEVTGFTDEQTGTELVYQFDPVTKTRGALVGPTTYETGGQNWIATYTGDFTDNLQVSVSYGENEYNRTTSPATADKPWVNEYIDGTFTYVGLAAGPWISIGDDRREMTRADVLWSLGDHDISFGMDVEDNFANENQVFTGGEYWVRDPFNTLYPGTCTTCPDGVARRRYYANGGSFETNSTAYYIQDVWDVNERLTLEIGLRNENFKNKNAEGGIFVEVEDQWAPRLAAVFDPKGDGRSKFFVNYGLYYLPIAANTNIRMAGGETYIHEWYPWDLTVDPNTAGPAAGSLGPIFATDVFGNGEVPDTRSVTDENLEPMYQSEIIVGYSFETDAGWELGLKGIYRNLETTIEDVAIDAAVLDYYDANGWTTIPGDELACDDGAGTPARDCDHTDYFTGFHQYVLTNPGNTMVVYIPEQDETITLTAEQLRYPEAERQYGAVEFTFARPFDGRWGFAGSYTWAHSWGNHEGYVKSDNAQTDAGITQNFDQPGLTDYSKGNLPNDRRHTIKAWGTYQLDSGLRFGGNFFYQTGRPRSCFGLHPTDVFAQAYGNSDSHFCGGEPVVRGSLGNTPSIMTVDANVQYPFEYGRTNILVSLDVFNLFDNQNPLRYNEDGDTANYLEVVSYQRPRTIRLSARVSFE